MLTTHSRLPVAAYGLACLCLALLTGLGGASAGEERASADPQAEAKELLAAFKSKDSTVRKEAAETAQHNQEKALTSGLTRLLSDKDGHVRDAAITALAGRAQESDRKKAASSLSARLPRLAKHPADRGELHLVIWALGSLGQRASIKPLLDPIKLDTSVEDVQARLNAVAEIPDAESVDRLIQFLDKGRRAESRAHRSAAQKALQKLTGTKVKGDADGWRAWWRENKSDFDFVYVAQERAQAEADKQAKAELKKKRAEERKNKREKRKKAKKKEGQGTGRTD